MALKQRRTDSLRQAMEPDEAAPYRIYPHNGGWEVLDDSARVVMKCRDERSATDYATLLNEAFRRGYKAGRRGKRQAG